MDELRIALLLLGIVVVVGVYFTTRRKAAAPLRNSEAGGRVEPSFERSPPSAVSLEGASKVGDMPLPEIAAVRDEPVVGQATSQNAEPEHGSSDIEADDDTPEIPQKVISLRIVKKDGGLFGAEPVILKLRSSGMQHGRFGIFHYVATGADNDADAMFSAASLTEPGSFDLQNVKEAELAGLSIFMLRPGPGRGVDAFDKMIEVARAVSISLEGELLDGDGSTLSIQRERFLREELIQYELQHLKLS